MTGSVGGISGASAQQTVRNTARPAQPGRVLVKSTIKRMGLFAGALAILAVYGRRLGATKAGEFIKKLFPEQAARNVINKTKDLITKIPGGQRVLDFVSDLIKKIPDSIPRPDTFTRATGTGS